MQYFLFSIPNVNTNKIRAYQTILFYHRLNESIFFSTLLRIAGWATTVGIKINTLKN